MSLVTKSKPSSETKAPSDYVVVDKEVKAEPQPVRVLNKGTAQMANGLIDSRRGSGKNRSRGKSRKMGGMQLPPELDATVSFKKVYRYISQDASATQKTLTVGTIMMSLGAMANTTTQVSSFCSSFRLIRFTLYPPSGTGTNIQFEWVEATTTGLNVRDEKRNKIIPTGITVESPMTVRPPKNTSVSWWWDGQASSVTLAALSAPVGTILDMEVEATLTNAGTNLQESSYTGLVIGGVYYPPLDGRTTNDWAPVGRPNAT